MTPISSLIPMVQCLARRHGANMRCAADREDLFQEGMVGLLEAASRYQADQNCRFGTYGGHRVQGAMRDYIRCLAKRGKEYPRTEPEIAILPRGEETHSIESKAFLRQLRKVLRDGLPGLDKELLEVLRLRFWEVLTTREAAARLQVSPPTIVRMERKALQMIRRHFQISHDFKST